jgi:hypothetical protein
LRLRPPPAGLCGLANIELSLSRFRLLQMQRSWQQSIKGKAGSGAANPNVYFAFERVRPM